MRLQFAPNGPALQTDLSPIFTHIYRGTGVYMEAPHASICTRVNATAPLPSK